MTVPTRLRQVVLAAEHLGPTSDELRAELGLSDGYHDPGVAGFGLENVVYAVGDRFIEIVAPVRDGTAAGRLLERDGPGGYMAIFQTSDLAGTRKRVDDLGVRVVWETELEDIAAMHLHPKDIGGAIVSVDQADPPQSWRWAGPEWTGAGVAPKPGGIRAMTVRADNPVATAERWAAVLGENVEQRDGSLAIVLDDGQQIVRFVNADGKRPGIAEVSLSVEGAERRTVNVGGMTFDVASP